MAVQTIEKTRVAVKPEGTMGLLRQTSLTVLLAVLSAILQPAAGLAAGETVDLTAQGVAAQGMAAQGMAAQGMAAQGMAAQGMAAQGMAAQGMAAQATAQGTPDKATGNAPLPVPRSLTLNALGNLFNWNRMPDGVNNPHCRPAPGQYPVVLVHGTFANAMLAFSALAPTLYNAGLCVYTFNYGGKTPDAMVHGLAPMEESARRVGEEVERVRQITGADKVHLVGHSQGGTLIHYYAKVLGGSRHIDTMVAVAPSLRGTDRVSASREYTYCVACGQQSPESAVIRRLNDGPIAQVGNRNFVLATENDWVVRPLEKQFIREPGVTNVLLQARFPGRWATHSGLLYDREALHMMTEWLTGGSASTEEAAP